MQALLDWFSSIGETIVFVVEYFIGMLADLVQMVMLLGAAAVRIPQVLSFLPSPIVTILALFLTAAILYKVIGREG